MLGALILFALKRGARAREYENAGEYEVNPQAKPCQRHLEGVAAKNAKEDKS